MDSKRRGVSRRSFLKAGGAAATAFTVPWIVPDTALGQGGRPAPSNRLVHGAIGIKGQGGGIMGACRGHREVQTVAICDVDSNELEKRIKETNNHYKNQDCKGYGDFRELLARDDIDIVTVGTPDHWHALVDIEAAKTGKDMYSEKPLSHKLAEGRAMCDAMEQYGRIFQVGSQQRSEGNFHHACELVRNGRIGKVRRVEVGLPGGGGGQVGGYTGEAPANLDYDFWLGPAPWHPYHPKMVHWDWRWNLDTGGGQLMDWIGHHNDIAHWGMGWDETGPTEVQAVGEFPQTGIYTGPLKYRIECKYEGGVDTVIAGGHGDIRGGTKWIGDDGWVWVNRGGLESSPGGIIQEKIGPEEIQLYKSEGHMTNFINCVKSRKPTICTCETGHRSASPGHLGLISMLLGGRKLKWNPKTEEIANDPEASRMLQREYRGPWRLS